VRELENAIERAAVLSNKETLEPSDFSDAADARRTPHAARLGTLDEAVEAAERQAITAALAATNGNRREAAQRLGVSLRTLFYKIDRYGIS
jgi:DNA-binding NtrC family response regulator